jgi:hypothetical protein
MGEKRQRKASPRAAEEYSSFFNEGCSLERK